MDFEDYLKSGYKRENFVYILKELLSDYEEQSGPIELTDSQKNNVVAFTQLGKSKLNGKDVLALEVELKKGVESSPTFQRNLVAQFLQKQVLEAALVGYYTPNEAKWKIALVTVSYKLYEQGIKKEISEAKRYYYVVGQENIHTALSQLGNLKARANTLEDLVNAFSIEPVTKEFYKEISNWYFWALKCVKFPNDAEKIVGGRNIAVIRFITRMMFIWFMKHKGLIKDELFDDKKIQDLLRDFSEQSSTYYKAILQNLFFATLNTPIAERDFRTEKRFSGFRNEDYMNHGKFRYQELFKNPEQLKSLFNYIPFLNGGLFECLDKRKNDPSNNTGKEIRIDGFSDVDCKQPVFPNFLFFSEKDEVDLNEDYDTQNQKYPVRGIINILKSYNFTVEESTPVDQEVALDPELLGKVFENLLASYNPETATTARKATGSYYTPRGIVNYMVDESLKEYFETKTKGSIENFDKKLEDLFSYASGVNPFTEVETDLLIQTIESLKVIDPAVGSGAFPMAMLQRLVFLLSKLDPHNTKWKAQQVKAIENNVKDPNLKNELIEEIETNFKDNELDYGRKLYLIQKCLYGVDIQPIAIQIAKLRFFISLLVNEKVDPNDRNNNYGIKPLPNLETKLVIANTLVDLDIGNRTLRSDNILNLEEQIQKKLSEYFSAYKKEEKEKIKEDYRNLVEKLKQSFENEGFPSNITEKIIKYDPFDTNIASSWFNPEWMFGIKEGFDIVIANPPYIRHEKIKDQKEDLKKQGYKVFNSTSDLYTYFYEKGYDLLKDNGILAFISSNKWMRAKYGENLRKFLKEKTILKELIDFGGYKVFDATVDTNIIIFEKGKVQDKNEFWYLNVENDFDGKDIVEYFNRKGNVIEQADLSDSAWTLADDKVLALKKKIENIGKPLKDWNVKIYRGILTGFNDAFIIDTKTKEEILANCKDDSERTRTEEIIKPILRGRDIHRYGYKWAGLWVIKIESGWTNKNKRNQDPEMFFKSMYPTLYEHFMKFASLKSKGKGLFDRDDQGDYWWELRDCDYYPEFEKEKIVWNRITEKIIFSYVDANYHVLDSTFMITGENLKFLIAVLNSDIIGYWIKLSAATLGEGSYGAKIYVENSPIPPITPQNQSIVQQIETLVDQILAQKQSNPDADISVLEHQIDQLVYKLYSLTEEEITIVEK